MNKTQHRRIRQPLLPVSLVHFAGIKRAIAPSAKNPDRCQTVTFNGIGAGRPTKPRAAASVRCKQVRFAGIGGGGRTLPPIAMPNQANPEAARAARQRQVDALLDQCALAAGITVRTAD